MEFKNIVGIDVGKESLDFIVLESGEKKTESKVSNTLKKIEKYIQSLNLDLSQTLFCMEHTGMYCLPLLRALEKMKAKIWIEGAMQIKKSIGLVRGKSDKIDAARIASYAYMHQKNVKLWEPERTVIRQLKSLLSQRNRLIKSKKSLEAPLKEGKNFLSKEDRLTIKKYSIVPVNAIKKNIEAITKQIEELIKSDDTIGELHSYATSVPYIGTIIGATVLVKTNEYKKINDPKKFACHSGIAPFEHTSGKSIRGKTRVSPLADKTLKTLMHLAAVGAISRTGEFKDYYDRKIAQGKNKMSVINAIRNKLILRLFSCVNNKKKYSKNNLVLA